MGFPIPGGFCSLNGESPCSFCSLLDFLKAHWHFVSTTFGLQRMLPFEHSLQLSWSSMGESHLWGRWVTETWYRAGRWGGLHSTRWWCHIPDPCTFPSTLGGVSLVAFPTYSISSGIVCYCVGGCFPLYTYQRLVFLCLQAKWLLYECLMSPWVWWCEELERWDGKHFRVAN